ncbi:MAG: hypothetical protein HYR90_03095 [Candidatus Andersenbacteria bacterium]|nr:hypothetical protein [Candidatus Andersenbacteria bacterium]MBI3250249.1 hypothetical protein [Candidatus Andersenbacteria bacterium]
MLGLRARLRDPGFWIDFLVVALLGNFGIIFRTMLVQNRMRMPAGDAFNFINGATELLYGKYPPQEKRPPFFSFLIAILDSFIQDPIDTSHIIIVISGVLGIIFMYFIGRYFGVYRPVMAGFSFLALFDPLLALYGVRPLSQGLFFALLTLTVLLALHIKTSRWYLAAMALSFTALALTRQEGVLISAVVWALLFLKLPWKKVLLVALMSCVFVAPWFVVIARSTGSPFKFPGSEAYVEEFASGERGTKDPRVVLAGIAEISMETWAIAWNSSVLVTPEGEESADNTPDAIAAFLVALLAIIGLGWMTVRRPKDMAIFFAAFALIVVIAAWYRASGKYASPFISTWYICAAAGLTAVSEIVRRLYSGAAFSGRLGAYIATIAIVWPLAPALAISGTSYIVSERGMNWARVQAVRYVRTFEAPVLIPDFTLLSRSYFGKVGEKTEPPHLGIYLINVSEQSVEEQRTYIISKGAQYIIDDGTEGILKLTQYLQERKEITLEKLFVSYLEGDQTGQLIYVYRFSPRWR